MTIHVKVCLFLVGFSTFSLASEANTCGFDCMGRREEELVNAMSGSQEKFSLNLFESSQPSKPISIDLFFYSRKIGHPIVVPLFPSSMEQNIPFLNQRWPTKIVIHGWKAFVPSLITNVIKNAYFQKGDYNLIMVDWSNSGAFESYPRAKSMLPSVATNVASFIDKICKTQKVCPKDIHIVGHSLGAHLAGIAGHLVKTGKIKRITGLDPAGPLFEFSSPLWSLTRSSADFVDVVHTCGYELGVFGRIGHVDFYPNSGVPVQPGCGFEILGECSHRRAYAYFAESILNPDGFLGIKCSGWFSYVTGFCKNSNETAPMGEYVPRSARGTYYLQTRTQEPFGMNSKTSSSFKRRNIAVSNR